MKIMVPFWLRKDRGITIFSVLSVNIFTGKKY